MKLNTLHDLLIDQLKDIYFAEKHLTKALPKLARAAASPELKEAFTGHLEETREHLVRLEKVFKLLGEPAKAKRCPAIIGLVEEGSEMISEDAEPEVRDAGLIAAAQRVEHYEIAAYGCARAFAKRLGFSDVVAILTKTIEEEGIADKVLTEIAEGGVNTAAVHADQPDHQQRNGSPRGAARNAGRGRGPAVGRRSGAAASRQGPRTGRRMARAAV